MWVALAIKAGRLPDHTSFKHIIAISFLMGIGFTMSLFISNLSFSNSDFTLVSKGGILFGSLISACIGIVFIFFLKKKE
jgi:NhaA family Na+:H+ antiporter